MSLLLNGHCRNFFRKNFVKNNFNQVNNYNKNHLPTRLISTTKQVNDEQKQQEQNYKRTSLYDFHLKYGAKMVPFAGHLMPLQYSDQTIIDSHNHTRSNCSIFDVSHMLQMKIYGNGSLKFLENICVADLQQLPENSSSLSLYTNNNGGIIDDLIVTKLANNNEFYIVSNASRIDEDLKNFNHHLELFRSNNNNGNIDVNYEILNPQKSLLAFQGPMAKIILQKYLKNFNLDQLKFMNCIDQKFIEKYPIHITRCGYTGEDGFEIQIDNENVEKISEILLLENPQQVKLAGLGARDSLRLEAGLCLYGNDIDENTTPVEAVLAWTIPKTRRTKERSNFPGSEIILKQLKKEFAPKIKRIGLISTKSSGPSARSGCKIFQMEQEEQPNDAKSIGKVTSGCPSPTLKSNIAMAYIENGPLTKLGTRLKCEIRGKYYEYEVVKMPFVPSKYFI